MATVSTEQSWRAAAALGTDREPSPTGRFYALFGFLAAAERHLFTSQAGIQARLVVILGACRPATNDSHTTLLAELLLVAWARVHSSTSPASVGGPRARGASHGGSSTGGRLVWI